MNHCTKWAIHSKSGLTGYSGVALLQDVTSPNVQVKISDARISRNSTDILVTYALGSCMGVCLYDPHACVGGMLHCLLPNSEQNPAKAQQNPFVYADTGMRALLEGLLTQGAVKRRMQVTLAGGARRLGTGRDPFDVGKNNYLAVRKSLWQNSLLIKAEDVGGSAPRTMYMHMADGAVMIKSGRSKKKL